MENIDGDVLDQMGQMMGQDKKTMDRVKQVLKNPEVVKRMQKLMNKSLSQTNDQGPKKSEKVGRNEPCPCKSGKKYKKCCLTNKNDNTIPFSLKFK